MLTAIVAAVLASLLTAFILKVLGVGDEVARHDRRIAVLNRELDRWIHDSDRERSAGIRGVLNAAGNQLYSGSTLNKLGYVGREYRQRWRDRASGAIDEFYEIVGSEGRLHDLTRRRRSAWPALTLSSHGRLLVGQWRNPIPAPGNPGPGAVRFEDLAASEREPEVAAFEESGTIPFPRRKFISRTA